MKVLIVYMSIHHRNTEKIAIEMAEAIDAEIAKPCEVENVEKYDLIGLGSGIYFFRHHRKLIEFVASIPENKKVFVFSTYGLGNPEIYHRPLKKKLLARKTKIVGEYACKGYDTFGPLKLMGGINKGKPDENDLENARKFAMRLIL